MPYIETKTNVKISKDKELALKSSLAEAIAIIPGKTEKWLMLSFQDELPMYFAGSDAPCAMLEVKIFGRFSDSDADKVTSAICSTVEKVLAIPADRIYIKYEETSKWGWNGSNF